MNYGTFTSKSTWDEFTFHSNELLSVNVEIKLGEDKAAGCNIAATLQAITDSVSLLLCPIAQTNVKTTLTSSSEVDSYLPFAFEFTFEGRELDEEKKRLYHNLIEQYIRWAMNNPKNWIEKAKEQKIY